jgi:hypothetical protein
LYKRFGFDVGVAPPCLPVFLGQLRGVAPMEFCLNQTILIYAILKLNSINIFLWKAANYHIPRKNTNILVIFKAISSVILLLNSYTMPAKDIYHNEVKNALIKDGWTITDDPYFIKYEDAELYADLAAEKPIAAERQGQKIVVEIKSFVGKSLMYDFHSALGQYIVYRKLIQLTQPEYKLYLAIDDVVYDKFFQRQSVQAVIEENHLLLIVVNTKKEEIQKWIN